ncbi:hypothetical protein KAR91_11325 [Candidatus Pacearchaeota archaeon]|nr:hypothetical protein [Candidatus Pacearchaeota archaeon]
MKESAKVESTAKQFLTPSINKKFVASIEMFEKSIGINNPGETTETSQKGQIDKSLKDISDLIAKYVIDKNLISGVSDIGSISSEIYDLMKEIKLEYIGSESAMTVFKFFLPIVLHLLKR